MNSKDFNNQIIAQFNGNNKSALEFSGTGLSKFREDALTGLNNLELPTTKNEEWKYTPLTQLLNHNFVLDGNNTEIDDISSFKFTGLEDNLLVFINGVFSEKHSHISDTEGIVIASLENGLKTKRELIEKYLGNSTKANNEYFPTLNSLLINSGGFIYVKPGKVIEKPVHLLFIASTGGKELLINNRNLFVAGENSQVKIIEHYVSKDASVYLSNNLTEIIVEEGAIVDHIKMQEESKNSFHFGKMDIKLQRSSNFSSHLVSLGGKISRNDFTGEFCDEGSECTLNGLYLLDGDRLFDAHTMIDHAKPNCQSHEHYKGILDDTSRGVFNGKVMVRKDAQKTNAFQQNNNILLSKDALVNTKPQLEIFADDVKCSHGATIGQLDDEAMFYLKARGIGGDEALAMLIHAFASDVVKSIKVNEIKNYIEDILTNKFNKE